MVLSNKEYVANHGDCCPFCESDNIDIVTLKEEIEYPIRDCYTKTLCMVLKLRCFDCKKKWLEVYVLDRYTQAVMEDGEV